jgi:hypothetical protein
MSEVDFLSKSAVAFTKIATMNVDAEAAFKEYMKVENVLEFSEPNTVWKLISDEEMPTDFVDVFMKNRIDMVKGILSKSINIINWKFLLEADHGMRVMKFNNLLMPFPNKDRKYFKGEFHLQPEIIELLKNNATAFDAMQHISNHDDFTLNEGAVVFKKAVSHVEKTNDPKKDNKSSKDKAQPKRQRPVSGTTSAPKEKKQKVEGKKEKEDGVFQVDRKKFKDFKQRKEYLSLIKSAKEKSQKLPKFFWEQFERKFPKKT